jgi:7,8-dihydro-6-hydroxymethylpterin-pyrophosphokinase
VYHCQSYKAFKVKIYSENPVSPHGQTNFANSFARYSNKLHPSSKHTASHQPVLSDDRVLTQNIVCHTLFHD